MTHISRVAGVVLFLLIIGTLADAQCRIDKMTLASAALPVYPPLAHQAAVQGEVVLTFDVIGQGSPSPTNIKAVSGNPIFIEEAKKELATWKLFISGPDPMNEHNCRTTFRYSLSDKRVSGTQDLEIRFHGLSTLDVKTDKREIEG
jgi:hypothetical protein